MSAPAVAQLRELSDPFEQLITDSDGDEAVTAARFTWDGHELLADDQDGRLPGL